MKKNSFFLVSTIIICLPIAVLVVWSVATKWMYPDILPSQLGFKYFWATSQEPNFLPAILNSLWIALCATGLTLLIALPAAKFFAFHPRFANRLGDAFIYLPFILPAIAIITSTQTVFIQLHLTGTFTGIIVLHTYFMLPYALQILIESYLKLGPEFEQTAKTLGASAYQAFFQVTFPLLRPGISAAAGLVFIISFSQYLPTFFIGGGKIITLPLLLLPYANNGRYGIASVYSLVFLMVSMFGVWSLKRVIGRNYHEFNR